MAIEQFHEAHCFELLNVGEREEMDIDDCQILHQNLKEKYADALQLDKDTSISWGNGSISQFPIASALTTKPVLGLEEHTVLLKAMVIEAAMTSFKVQGGLLHSSAEGAMRSVRCLHKNNYLIYTLICGTMEIRI